MPDIQGSFREEIAARFDEVYYMKARHVREGGVEKVIYEAHTKPGRNFVGKSRDDIPSVITNPDYATLKELYDV